MLDDDDIGLTWLWLLLIVVVGVVMCFVIVGKSDECAIKTCPVGLSSQLLDLECLCVGRPVEDGGRP